MHFGRRQQYQDTQQAFLQKRKDYTLNGVSILYCISVTLYHITVRNSSTTYVYSYLLLVLKVLLC